MYLLARVPEFNKIRTAMSADEITNKEWNYLLFLETIKHVYCLPITDLYMVSVFLY